MSDPFSREQEDPEEEELPPEEGEEGWQDPIHCPVCGSSTTRLVEMRYEVGLYQCEDCGTTFEGETG